VTSVAVVVAFVLTTGAAASVSRAAKAATRDAKDAPRVIIDTDFSKWWDDVTALGLANVLDQQGKVRVLGIVSDVPNRVAVAAIDAIDTAYGNGNIPLGAVTQSDADPGSMQTMLDTSLTAWLRQLKTAAESTA
jgi:hypothetical protein